jgi:hypothetical protein
MESVDLAAYFVVRCTSPGAGFLNGRFVWANWDIEELKMKEFSIREERKLTFSLLT